ncbi:Ribosomal protein L4 domain containing protein [Russula decolorans]
MLHRGFLAAFGNMCRGGRMFAPTKTWCQWHVKVNQNQHRFATVSALAVSVLPSLILARGHHIEEIEEVPLVVGNAVESFHKTKEAIALLKSLHAYRTASLVGEWRRRLDFTQRPRVGSILPVSRNTGSLLSFSSS